MTNQNWDKNDVTSGALKSAKLTSDFSPFSKTLIDMAEFHLQRKPSIKPGAYLGEISALHFLHLPPHLSPLPLLLAGSGSELLIYDIRSGLLLKSLRVFEGIRVHGISLITLNHNIKFLVAVYGEKRLKLFKLDFDGKELKIEVELVRQLAKFDHWVIDACFLREDNCLSIGLSDNSIAFWNTDDLNVHFRVKYPDRCLLYSMRIWGDSIETLRIASGTIYNEIIVWKLIPQDLFPSSGNSKTEIHGKKYTSIHLCRLKGHEGSIFRIAWSYDGSKLMSVSDDRSARIWETSDLNPACSDVGHGDKLLNVLFGHSARIWDCHISDSIVITAGEDCTCRLWRVDGKQISVIKEHIGRGIWRCLYDPSSSLLITAGFDSAIKVHFHHFSSLREVNIHNGDLEDSNNQIEVLNIGAPRNVVDFMDSKSEYVRCLRFTQEDILYVATNNGFLYHVQLHHGNAIWTDIAQVGKEAPVICMDLITIKSSYSAEDNVAVGDGKGNAMVIRVATADSNSKSSISCTWVAEKERQLLGIYWCKSLGSSHLFTADPRGILKLWKVDASSPCVDDDTNTNYAILVSVFESPFGLRIMSLDTSIKDEVLICGDQRGNLIMYPFPKAGMVDSFHNRTATEKVHAFSQFKGAHGISSVTSISIDALSPCQVEVHTTGADGCICYFKYYKHEKTLDFVGMKQVKELSLIQSVHSKSISTEGLPHGNYAVGFMSAYFIIWNLSNESKTVQISCGGGRRPHSYYIGDVPEYQRCFAYVKDNDIHIHRLWAPVQGKQLIPKVLHIQYHGRETHSLCFISPATLLNSVKNDCSWLATGCEDGTVRITRYTAFDTESWCESKLLGEHVGGSAVRAIYFVSKTHSITKDQKCISNANLATRKDDHLLLISVGAKQVLTSWILQNNEIENQNLNSSNTDCAYESLSFQWLSTHMPPKFASSHKKLNKLVTIENGSVPAESKLNKHRSELVDQHENDWRYMAVTAFLVKHDDDRLTVCFTVVSCSDATLMLRVLLLPYRLWVDVASLVSQTSPVLALQHLIVPPSSNNKDNVRPGTSYLVISGSTNGDITFWDLTETVEDFMQKTSELNLELLVDYNRRPQTGRGSQGGRWWKSLTKNKSPEHINSNTSFFEINELSPLYVLKSVHMSGVNCLHVSEIQNHCLSGSDTAYCILSGGDDQAVHYLAVTVTTAHGQESTFAKKHSSLINVVHQDRVDSGHSSAVKGIWTDGMWTFSTGLDQRIRCWKLNHSGKLTEHAHLIVSVPEPEALDARKSNSTSGRYQIAVAGRGMQMAEFYSSDYMDQDA